MKYLTKIGFFSILSLIFLFSSCEKDEVTSISLSRQNLTMKLGQSDSLDVTVKFTGEIDKQPVTLSVADSKIASATLGVSQGKSKSSEGSFSKNIVIKSLSPGTTTVNIQVGTKTTSVTVSITQTNITFIKASLTNYGPILYDSYDIDNNYNSVEFSSGTVKFDTITKRFSGTGKILVMDFMIPLSFDNIAPGDYNAANTGDAYSFFPGSVEETYHYPTFIIDVVNGAGTFQIISGGAFTVSKNNDGAFMIEGNMNSDTDGIVHFSYNGNITPENKQQEDQTPIFTSGTIEYYADAFQSGLSNTYLLDLKSPTDSMTFFINTSLTATNSIPSGEYPVITLPLTSASQFKPYTITPGYIEDDGTYAYRMGTWYWGKSKMRLETGSVNILRVGTNYNITYELYNHFGVSVSGVYTGPLTFFDKTSTSSGIKAAKIKGASKIKSTSRKTIVNKTIGRMPWIE
ncbi:MAG TPA: hypothetical protein VK152_04110 [Paludibacter sp.]|nr:hypothetical protein [Paludibacter sp.]